MRPCLFFSSSSRPLLSLLVSFIILCFALHVFDRDKFPQVVHFLLVTSFPNRGHARVLWTRQRITRDGKDKNQYMPHGTNKRTHRRTRHTTTKHASFRPHFLCPPQTQNSHTQQRKNSERMFCRTLPKKTQCRVAVLDTQSTKWHFLGDPCSSLHAPSLPCTLRCLLLLLCYLVLPLMQERDMCHNRRRGSSVNSFNQNENTKMSSS